MENSSAQQIAHTAICWVSNTDIGLNLGQSNRCKTCDKFKVQVDPKTSLDAKQQLMLEWEVHKTHVFKNYIRHGGAHVRPWAGFGHPYAHNRCSFYKWQLWISQLIMFSDACGGQNRNINLFFMAAHHSKSRTVGICIYPMILTCPVSKQQSDREDRSIHQADFVLFLELKSHIVNRKSGNKGWLALH